MSHKAKLIFVVPAMAALMVFGLESGSGASPAAAPGLNPSDVYAVARAEIADLAADGRSGWSRASRPTAVFPVYIEGIDGVSYYEVKVQTGDQDAGYVLVNVNGTDIQVPELATQGPTLNELYRVETGRADLKIVRYNCVASAAKSLTGGPDDFVAAIGLTGGVGMALFAGPDKSEILGPIRRFDAAFRREARAKQCAPHLLKEALLRSDPDPRRDPRFDGDSIGRVWLKEFFRRDGGLAVAGQWNRDTTVNDIGVYDARNGDWEFDTSPLRGVRNYRLDNWGGVDDLPVMGDFDRDGYRDDLAVFRPSNRHWYFDYDHDGDTDETLDAFGLRGDYPIAGDFDRDSFCDDTGVYRPSTGRFYLDYNHNGVYDARITWGAQEDVPVAGDFDHDGFVDDLGVFRGSNSTWYYDYDHNGTTNYTKGTWGENGDQPLAADFDGDGSSDDVALFRSTDGSWFVDYNRNATTDVSFGPWGRVGWNWHMPSWTQHVNGSGYPVGCGPTVWSLIYAYWKQWKGKSRLFDGTDILGLTRAADGYSGVIMQLQWTLSDLTDTVYGTSGGQKYGMTYPWKMEDAIEYAHDKGYGSASTVRWRGGEWDKWDAVRGEIRADRPVILYITLDGVISDHYVGIEATIRKYRSGTDVIGYLGNWGWGEGSSCPQKWFFTRPTTHDPHHICSDAFFVRF